MPAVDVGIVQSLPAAPIQFLKLEAIAGGTHTVGDYILTRSVIGIPLLGSGIVWQVDLVGINVGGSVGGVIHYPIRAGQFAVRHRMLTGELVVSQIHDIYYERGVLLFANPSPEDVLCNVQPAFGISLYWMVLA